MENVDITVYLPLLRSLSRMYRDSEEAFSIGQLVLVKIAAKLASVETDKRRAYVRRSIINAITDANRAEQTMRRHNEASAKPNRYDTPSDDFYEFLDSLPERIRIVTEMYAIDRMSIASIRRVTGYAPQTIRKYIRLACHLMEGVFNGQGKD